MFYKTAGDDGLKCPEVGSRAETKYRLLALYDELFSTGMKRKWDQRMYIDMYAGAGYGHIRGSKKILKGSPEHANVSYLLGSCDSQIELICNQVPKGSSTNKVLSLCLVDPFDFGLKFETLKKLFTVFVDFLVLLAIGMGANRNYEHYVEGDSTKIDEALGNTDWRNRWKSSGPRRSDFRRLLAQEFSMSMQSLGYLGQPLDRMKLVRSDDRNLALYYLALLSLHKTAYKFWDEVLEYGNDQSAFAWTQI